MIYPRYVPAFESFWEICRQYENEKQLHFSCYIGEGERVVEELYKNSCDLVIYLKGKDQPVDRLCKDLHVKFVKLKKMKYCIQLSEEHPLLQKQPFDFEKLKQYPYVAFADLQGNGANWFPWEELVNPDKLICVQSTSSRVSMVANSCAFSIVLPHSSEYNQKNHVVQIPFGDKDMYLGYLYSLERGLTPLAEEYLNVLKMKIEHL